LRWQKFFVTIALTVGTLRNISFVVGRFKFGSALLKVFDSKDVFVVGSSFEINEEHGERGVWCDSA
jgi:hypothetical protein